MPKATTTDKTEQKKAERLKLAELRQAVKDFRKAMDGIAKSLAKFDGEDLDDWTAKLEKLGFNISKDPANNAIAVAFTKFSCRKAKPQPDDKSDGFSPDPEVEPVPPEDLVGSDGEIPNLDVDDDEIDDYDDDTFGDYRDEVDEDLVASRREYFGMASEYGENVDE